MLSALSDKLFFIKYKLFIYIILQNSEKVNIIYICNIVQDNINYPHYHKQAPKRSTGALFVPQVFLQLICKKISSAEFLPPQSFFFIVSVI